jgi:hypothetical protein
VTIQRVKQSPVVHAAGLLTVEHHKIDSAQVSLVASKALSNNSFYSISVYSQARILLGYGQPQPGCGKIAWPAEYRKTVIRVLDWALKHRTVLRRLQKPAVTGKACLFNQHHETDLRGQPGPALGTTCVNDLTAITCRHTCAKSMGTCPLQSTWLKCSFHAESPIINAHLANAAKRPGKKGA